MIKAKWIGVAAVAGQLMALKPVLRAHARSRLEKAADDLVEQMKREVSVDDGEVRDSIRREPSDKSNGVVVKAGDVPATTRYGPGYVVDVALTLEYGTATRRPKPFFRPVIDRNRKKIRKYISEAAQDAAED